MKKFLISTISVCCMFLNVFNVSAFENPNNEIEPYVVSIPCDNCLAGAMVERTKTVYGTWSTHACIHGLSGQDRIRTKTTYGFWQCLQCGHKSEFEELGGVMDVECLGY